MADIPRPTQRWFHLTPDRLVLGLLAVEGFLFLSERCHWFAFNQHKGWTVLIAVASGGAAMLLMLIWLAASLVFRFRFQFSIRSLLVLTLAVAIPCSWLSWEMKQASKQKEALQEIDKLLGVSEYDFEAQQGGDPRAVPPGAAWLRRLLGEDFFASVVAVNVGSISDADLGQLLEQLKGLTQLGWLKIEHTLVTDGELKQLKGLTQLRWLELPNTKVSNAGLEHLKELSQLQRLDLTGTQITDAGLEYLKGLPQLQELDLARTRVTDDGLEQLKGLTQLKSLNLGGTLVTDEGLNRLQQALPQCEITRHVFLRKNGEPY